MQNPQEMTSLGERMAHIEGQVPYLATKADVADLATRLTASIGSLDAKVTALEATVATTAWGLGIGLAVFNLATALGGVLLGAWFSRQRTRFPASRIEAQPSPLGEARPTPTR